MVNSAVGMNNVDLRALSLNSLKVQVEERDSGAIRLDSCFEAFEREELLTGADQWYCNKCAEHRDIHKKLELFKVPKILII